MSYQVLARKWRPRKFAEVVGQQHVLKPLMNALATGRLHHAWLLTGTRGVGKTTIARILAKSLNCEKGITADPCGECSACVAIEQGRFVDLLEIDAASRTKVEDTREVLDNVQYKPTHGRYKVYLIDEVHMLSRHSFNALLKTLEEPPEHVKFLLATTDPQKLPITVLSRCLQFNLKAMERAEIATHLQYVLEQEQIPFEEAALPALARAARGSMRDALSLTDQAIAQGDQQVTIAGVQQMLGAVPSFELATLLEHVLTGDGAALLASLARVAGQVPDLSSLLSEMQNYVHQLALYQAVPEVAETLNLTSEDQQLAQQLPAELLQVYYDILVQGRRDLDYAADVRSGVEMTLLRLMAFRPQKLTLVERTPADTTAVTKVAAPVAAPEPVQAETEAETEAADSGAAVTPDVAAPEDTTAARPDVAPAEVTEERHWGDDAPPEVATENVPAPSPDLDLAPREPAKVSEPVQQEPVEAPAAAETTQDTLASLLETRAVLQQKMQQANETPRTDVSPPQKKNPEAIAQQQPLETTAPEAVVCEPEVATEPEPASTSAEVREAPVTAPEVTAAMAAPTINLEIPAETRSAAEIDRWSAWIDNLAIDGLARQLARNSVLEKSDAGYVLYVREAWQHLMSDGATSAIREALQQAMALEIVDVGLKNTPQPTPFEIQQAIDAQRLAQAKQRLAEDPLALALQQQFGAELDDSSVQPL